MSLDTKDQYRNKPENFIKNATLTIGASLSFINAQMPANAQNIPQLDLQPKVVQLAENDHVSKVKETHNGLPVYSENIDIRGGIVIPNSPEVHKYGHTLNAKNFDSGTVRTRESQDFEQYFNKGQVMVPVSVADSGTGSSSLVLGIKSEPSRIVNLKMEFKARLVGYLKEDIEGEVTKNDNLSPIYDLEITIDYPKSNSGRVLFIQGQQNNSPVGFVITPGKTVTITNYGAPGSIFSLGSGVLPK
jgi:hypothetical protein